MNRTIEFVLFPGALGLDITGPLEVFKAASVLLAQDGKSNEGYTFKFTASEKGNVPLSSGLEINATADFKEKFPVDMLLVPGGDNVAAVINDPEIMDYIKSRARQAKRIISICSGTFILAEAGILEGKKATTHWMLVDALEKQHTGIAVDHEAIFVRDGHVYTSAGVSSGIDLALAIVEEDHGESLAMTVARMLVVYYKRPGSQAQFSNPLKVQEAAGKVFANLHHWLVENMDAAVSVEQMAEFSGMSPRNFARVFKSETGMTPAKYLEVLRLDRAREIMMAGKDSLERIAEASGFGREEKLRRAFLRRFGITPSQYRLHFRKN